MTDAEHQLQIQFSLLLREKMGLKVGEYDRFHEQGIRMFIRLLPFLMFLLTKNREYNESWKKRGGVDSFMMLARKWDRIEEQVKRHDWNILKALAADTRPEGLLDDVKDLLGYLLLVQDEGQPKDLGAAPGRGYVDQDHGENAPATLWGYAVGDKVEVLTSKDPVAWEEGTVETFSNYGRTLRVRMTMVGMSWDVTKPDSVRRCASA